MAIILQLMYSNAFSWKTMNEIQIQFNWNVFWRAYVNMDSVPEGINFNQIPLYLMVSPGFNELTHWGWVTHICVSDLTIIGSDNGLSLGRRQAIIRTNAGISVKKTLGTSFNKILIKIILFSFKKMRLKVSSAKRQPFCRDLNVLKVPDQLLLCTEGR